MKKIILKSRPSGEVQSENFKFVEADCPVPRDGEILVQAQYFSVDPYMRNRMNNIESYVRPYELNEAISGDGIAEVVKSNNDLWEEGDLVVGSLPWQEFTIPRAKKIQKIESGEGLSPTAYLSVLGLTGLTAYFGMLDIGQPEPGETVVISAAAGAVGSVAGQIAKIKKCKTIGITSSEIKAGYLRNDLGFDDCIDYKKIPNVRKELRKSCPEKIDIYFDNVGGEISDGVFYSLNDFSRVILCGQIALYNLNRLSIGPRLYPQFLIHRTKIQGFIVYDYADRFKEAQNQLKDWVKEGTLKYRENIIEGFENIPAAFQGLFSGENIGKQLVKV